MFEVLALLEALVSFALPVDVAPVVLLLPDVVLPDAPWLVADGVRGLIAFSFPKAPTEAEPLSAPLEPSLPLLLLSCEVLFDGVSPEFSGAFVLSGVLSGVSSGVFLFPWSFVSSGA